MDKFRIDSHKLIYHVPRVNSWLEGENIYPVYMEVSPIGACNHRCLYCALDFMGYRPRALDTEIFCRRLKEMGSLGVKSIMYAGEGEPFLHKDILKIIRATKSSGIDAALTTNGVLFRKDMAQRVLADCSWIKVSINAGRRQTYAGIHRTKPADFDTVMQNMAHAAKVRKAKGYKCALGMQVILLPDNYREITLLARKAKDIGMDYLVVKPYSHHPSSKTTRYKDIKYSGYLRLAKGLESLNGNGFNVIFRAHTMQKWDEAKRSYKRCLALPFWAYIDAGGDVWACSVYLAKKKFSLGNIFRSKFQEVWEGKKRREFMRWAGKSFDIGSCRINCRMDAVNRYLWELKHHPEHVNFI